MQVQETSAQTYRELQPTLAQRQRAVLVALEAYHHERGCWPTAYELFRWMESAHFAVRDVNDVRPRLTELKERGEIVEGEKRRCGVTGHTAGTWRPNDGRLF
jgi:hypothetical protein